MPSLDPRIIQGLAEANVIFQRGVPGHSIVEAFLVGGLPSLSRLTLLLSVFSSNKLTMNQFLCLYSALEGRLCGLSKRASPSKGVGKANSIRQDDHIFGT